MYARWSAAALCLMAACGDEQEECATGPVEVQVGTGHDAFQEIPGGADLSFFFGPQGGYHVYGSVRARGITAGTSSAPGSGHPVVRFQLRRDQDVIGASGPAPRIMAATADGRLELMGQFVFLVPMADPAEMEGDSVELEVQITDRCENQGADRRSGILRFAGTAPTGPP